MYALKNQLAFSVLSVSASSKCNSWAVKHAPWRLSDCMFSWMTISRAGTSPTRNLRHPIPSSSPGTVLDVRCCWSKSDSTMPDPMQFAPSTPLARSSVRPFWKSTVSRIEIRLCLKMAGRVEKYAWIARPPDVVICAIFKTSDMLQNVTCDNRVLTTTATFQDEQTTNQSV